MEIDKETRVGDVVSKSAFAIRVFQRHEIDYCCGGKQRLGDVCREKQLSFDGLRREIEIAMVHPLHGEKNWSDHSLTELVSHIVARYHIPLRGEFRRLRDMLQEVTLSDGARRPELASLAAIFFFLVDELEPHMRKEEETLFPYIQRLESLHRRRNSMETPPFGTIGHPISVLEPEHESAGEALAELRRLTRNYQEPPDASNAYRGLFYGLAELDRDLQEHIHIENNVLFPRAIALEEELHQGTVSH